MYVDRAGVPVAGNGGNHRLEMVRLQGIPSVPMLVRGAQRRWVRRCFDRFGPPLGEAIEGGLAELRG